MINFKDVQTNTGEFSSLEEGWYTLKVEDATLTSSKNGPNTMIKVKFAVVSPAKYSKRKVWNNFNLTSKSLWALKLFMECAELNPEALGSLEEEAIADALKGAVTQAFLEASTTPDGKASNNVINYRKMPNADLSTPITASMFK